MRTLVTLLTLAVLILTTAARAAGPTAGPELKTEDDKAFYAFGLNLSQQLGGLNLTEHDLDMLKAGLTDGVLKKKRKVDVKEFYPKFQQLARDRMSASATKEKKAGQEYLDKAAKEKSATKTASGLVIQEIKAGAGEMPRATDQVKVYYTGSLIDGTVFDSSVQRDQPVPIALTQTIKCWAEALPQMKVGGKAKIVCPSDLAYGDQPRPGINPGSTLVFEVELIDIIK